MGYINNKDYADKDQSQIERHNSMHSCNLNLLPLQTYKYNQYFIIPKFMFWLRTINLICK